MTGCPGSHNPSRRRGVACTSTNASMVHLFLVRTSAPYLWCSLQQRPWTLGCCCRSDPNYPPGGRYNICVGLGTCCGHLGKPSLNKMFEGPTATHQRQMPYQRFEHCSQLFLKRMTSAQQHSSWGSLNYSLQHPMGDVLPGNTTNNVRVGGDVSPDVVVLLLPVPLNNTMKFLVIFTFYIVDLTK